MHSPARRSFHGGFRAARRRGSCGIYKKNLRLRARGFRQIPALGGSNRVRAQTRVFCGLVRELPDCALPARCEEKMSAPRLFAPVARSVRIRRCGDYPRVLRQRARMGGKRKTSANIAALGGDCGASASIVSGSPPNLRCAPRSSNPKRTKKATRVSDCLFIFCALRGSTVFANRKRVLCRAFLRVAIFCSTQARRRYFLTHSKGNAGRSVFE